MALIGRKSEIEVLENCFNSDESEFVAIYGRRRIGKTFLIKTLFEEKFAFYVTGILNGDRKVQLDVWNDEIMRFGGIDLPVADNWIKAFMNLNTLIEQKHSKDNEKKVIFLDEIPWMATRSSGFLTGLDYFWNRWASSRKDILLIICGSAASWITDNIINDKGGLHNRLTRQILLEPFTLKESEQYIMSRNVPMTRYQIAEAYMIFGGVPFYLSLLESKLSLYQNVDQIYFAQGAPLRNEFDNLFRSLFKNAENYIKVVELLAVKGIGLSRDDIVKGCGMADGGSLTKILKDLCISGFIRECKAFGQKKKDSLYQLLDFFSLFDIRFRREREMYKNNYWLNFSSTQTHAIWSGFAYEKLCLLHLPQILKALGISGVLTSASSWRGKHEAVGAQVDLVIDRNDNVINLCEIKFSAEQYMIQKKLYESLRDKRTIFKYSTKTRKTVLTTMITTYGLKANQYSGEIHSQVVLDDLFD